MASLEASQLHGRRLLLDLLGVVQIFEHFLRRAHGLLEDVVDAGQPLHRLVQHQQRDHETGEFARGHRCALIWVRA